MTALANTNQVLPNGSFCFPGAAPLHCSHVAMYLELVQLEGLVWAGEAADRC